MPQAAFPLLIKCCLIILITLFGQQGNSQPNANNRQRSKQQANTQPSATPSNNSNAQNHNEANTESSRQTKERDSQDAAFKAEQLRQNRIIVNATIWIAIFAGLSFVIGCAYAFFSFRQLREIQKQAGHAGEQVGKMEAQLGEMRKLHAVSDRQAETMQASLVETQKLVSQNERAVAASEAQVAASQDAVKAANYSIAVTQEGLYDEQQAYVGIKEMKISRLDVGQHPVLTITWMNGGKTPAWRFRSTQDLVLGEKPTDWGGYHSFEDDFSDIKNSFIPAGEERTVEYTVTHFRPTEEMVEAMHNASKNLYVLVEWSFINFKGEKRNFFIWALYDLFNEGFVELEDEQQYYYPQQ